MGMRRSAAHAVKHPSVASARSEQAQANLRVGETGDGSKQGLSLTGTLQGVVTHEGPVTDGGTQQFAVVADAALAISGEEEFTRQMGLQSNRVSASDNNGLTLAEVELEPQARGTSLRVSKCGTNNSNRASQDTVVKEEGAKVSWPGPELKSQRLYGCSKQQGPEGVALLDSAGGGQDVLAELQAGRLAVAPGGPAGEGNSWFQESGVFRVLWENTGYYELIMGLHGSIMDCFGNCTVDVLFPGNYAKPFFS